MLESIAALGTQRAAVDSITYRDAGETQARNVEAEGVGATPTGDTSTRAQYCLCVCELPRGIEARCEIHTRRAWLLARVLTQCVRCEGLSPR